MLLGALLNCVFWTGVGLVTTNFRRDAVERILAAVVIGFVAIVLSVELLSCFGWIDLLPISCLCGLTLLIGVVAMRRREESPPGTAAIAGRVPVPRYFIRASYYVMLCIAVWAVLDSLLFGLLTPVQINSDAPIYHLPFAMRWAADHQLGYVPTPFGEEGATYFPANGDLWLTWLTVTGKGATWAKAGQWPFVLVGGLALYRLARLTGGRRDAAVVPAAVWMFLPLTLHQSSLANVDLIFAAFYFIALVFILQYREQSRRGRRSYFDLVMAALSAGCLLGTKSIGLIYSPMILAPLVWSICRKNTQVANSRPEVTPRLTEDVSFSTPSRGRMWALFVLATGVALPSMYWYARNLWWTGNPVYPLDVQVWGHRVLSGWYAPSAMRTTAYHCPVNQWPVLLMQLHSIAGPYFASLWVICLLAGLIGTAAAAGQNRRELRLLAALALAHVAVYWWVVPYNTQARFLLPAFGLGLISLSNYLSHWPSLVWLVLLLFVGHTFGQFSTGVSSMPAVSFRTFHALIALGDAARGTALPMSIVLAVLTLQSKLRLRWLAAAGMVISACGIVAEPLADSIARQSGRGFYPSTGLGSEIMPAWTIVERASPPSGTRVAYTGGNLPYYLSGADGRNTVRYININRHADWLPHDYHKARRESGQRDTAPTPWPEWNRQDANYDAWLQNLQAAQIELLFISRVNLHGRFTKFAGERPPFPIEKQWADNHAEAFAYLGPSPEGGADAPHSVVYRVIPFNRNHGRPGAGPK